MRDGLADIDEISSSASRIGISRTLQLALAKIRLTREWPKARFGDGENEITYLYETTMARSRIESFPRRKFRLSRSSSLSSAAAAFQASRKFLWQARRKYRPTLIRSEPGDENFPAMFPDLTQIGAMRRRCSIFRI